MALASVDKAAFLTRPRDRERMMSILQASGAVHMVDADVVLGDGDGEYLTGHPTDLKSRISPLETRLHDLAEAIRILELHAPKRGFVSQLVQDLPQASLESFHQLAHYDESPIIEALAAIQAGEQARRAEIEELRRYRAPLERLADVDIRLEHLRDGRCYFLSVVTSQSKSWDQLADELTTTLGETSCTAVLSTSANAVTALVAGRIEDRSAFIAWADANAVSTIDLSRWTGTARENLDRLTREEAALTVKLGEANEERVALSANLPDLRAAYDYQSTLLEKLQAAADLRSSRYTAFAAGWIRTADVPRLESRFSAAGLDVHVVTADAGPEDAPPVAYDNPPVIRPFELISDLYSRPRPGEIDPTPYMAGFFALYLGICLTDAGYGLILAVAAFLMLRFGTRLGEGSRKLIRILLYSGIATIVVGMLTGGYFGLAPAELPGPLQALDRIVVLAPMEKQMTFLVFTLALGVLQVGFGFLLKLHWNLRYGSAKDAFFDQVPWLLILIGVVFLVLAGRVAPAWFSDIGIGMLVVAAAVILLFAERTTRNPLKRLGAGIFSLYGVSSLFGDILSYVRLFALGLATGVIAGVVNFIAQLVVGVPYVGIVLMILVLVFGHLINLIINALGGFIHTTRLQFVEFFGKFYEGGGEPFNAFRLNTRYTTVLDAE